MLGCTSRHIEESVLEEAFILAWNTLLENRDEIKKRWELYAEFGNPLEQYRALQFSDLTEDATKITSCETDFLLRTLDHIKVYESGKLIIKFMDGTELELDGE